MHFAPDGSYISVYGCSGKKGSCRNSPDCQCQKNVGPLPRGSYRIGKMQTFKSMPYC